MTDSAKKPTHQCLSSSSKKPYWLKRGITARALWPLSMLFKGVSGLRRSWLEKSNIPWRVKVPVVIVGNLTVGGAGKTPTTLALIQHLQEQGHRPAVVSRGYGRSNKTPSLEVHANSTPQDVGDEPLLIKRRTGVPVFVAAKRIQAVNNLLEKYPTTTVILSDDGLQHYALDRDIEIAVFDERGAGNGWLIPAGPLREPLKRADEVDLILYNASAPPLPFKGYMAQRDLGGYLSLKEWLELYQPISEKQGKPQQKSAAWHSMQGLAAMHDKEISAAAGIGSPERFFNMLIANGIALKEVLPLADHHDIQPDTFDQLTADIILITEKDAAKCSAHQEDSRLYVVTLAYMPEKGFFEEFDLLLKAAQEKLKTLE